MNDQQHMEKTLKDRMEELERWHKQKVGIAVVEEKPTDDEAFKSFVKFMDRGCCGG